MTPLSRVAPFVFEGTAKKTAKEISDQLRVAFQKQGWINFLDYLSRQSRGRTILFVTIGSASAIGSHEVNERLSRERSEAPVPIVDQYLVNVPHQFHKITGIGDAYAPKDASLSVEQRYQNVRIIAVYQTDQVPLLSGDSKG